MVSKPIKTLRRVFESPVRSDIKWADVIKLLDSLGAVMKKGSGSRINVELNGVVAIFHRPHPKPDTNKGAVKSLRRFLLNAGVRIP